MMALWRRLSLSAFALRWSQNNALCALWLAAGLVVSVFDALADAPLSFALDEGEAVEIGAQGDITWSEVHHSLTARKSAFVAQGQQRVDADTIFFFFADDHIARWHGFFAIGLNGCGRRSAYSKRS